MPFADLLQPSDAIIGTARIACTQALEMQYLDMHTAHQSLRQRAEVF